MSGRVWRHRQIGRGDYEIESANPDGTGRRVEALVSFPSTTERPSLAIRQMVEKWAALEGGTVEGVPIPNVDWQQLGWRDQADHDDYLRDVHRQVEAWRGNPYEAALLTHVNVEKARTGIPPKAPYSLTELVELARIIERAPAIVAQDLAAEGTAA